MSESAVPEPMTEITELLETMLEPDGYGVVLHSEPSGPGRMRVEIVAKEGACEECLVPKDVLAGIIAAKLPAGMHLSSDDLIYPGDSGGA